MYGTLCAMICAAGSCKSVPIWELIVEARRDEAFPCPGIVGLRLLHTAHMAPFRYTLLLFFKTNATCSELTRPLIPPLH